MRKSVLLTFALLAALMPLLLNAQSIVSTEAGNRNVIIEEYTGVNCLNCPDGHRRANGIMAANPGRVWSINIHQGVYANTIPDYRTPFGDELAAQTGLTGYPAGTINRQLLEGDKLDIDRALWDTYTQQCLAESSYANIAAESTIDFFTRELTVKIEIYYTADGAETNNLNVALLQNNILGRQAGMNYNPDQIIDGQYNHTHMLRHLLTGQWGEEITTTRQGTFVEKAYTYIIPEDLNDVSYELENLEVLVFIAEGHTDIITGAKSGMTFINAVPRLLSAEVEERYSCDAEIYSYISIQNIMTETLTSAEFAYEINGSTFKYIRNDLNIPSLTTDTIHFPGIDIIANIDQPIIYSLITFNELKLPSTPFEYITKKSIVEASAGEIFLKLVTDRFGADITFSFLDSEGNIILKGGPFEDLKVSGTSINEIYFAPPHPGCYKLEVYDKYGDGINNKYGAGYFTITDSEGNLMIHDNGDFGAQANYYIIAKETVGIDKIDEMSIDDIMDADIQVINLLGQVVLREDKVPSIHALDLSRLGTGVYIIKANYEEKIFTRKIIINANR